MTLPRSRLRRWLGIGALLALVVLGTLVLARRQLVRAAVGAVLRLGGASEVRLSVAHASPWRVVLDDVRFQMRAQPFAAERVRFERARWWTPSLGHVQVERARVAYHADGSGNNPWAWATYEGGKARVGAVLPAERLSLDGTLVIKASALTDQEVEIKVEAEWAEGEEWRGTVTADGRGLEVAGSGRFSPGSGAISFAIAQARVELAIWQDFVQRLVILPGGRWEAGGILTASVRVESKDGEIRAGGTVAWSDGTLANAERKVAAKGIQSEVTFADFDRMESEGGTLFVEEILVGKFPIRNAEALFDFRGADRIGIRSLKADALGGSVAVDEPFNVFLDQAELDVVFTAHGLHLEQILALADNIPAKATGQVDGRVPLQFDRNGVRFGSGWLALSEGTTAELQLSAAGLLTRGADPRSPAFAVLQKVETGLLRLRVGELRLDIYPPNRPPGRSATLRVAGEPMDPSVKAPVSLDLNVNGPVEKLLNLGLGSRVSIGTKP